MFLDQVIFLVFLILIFLFVENVSSAACTTDDEVVASKYLSSHVDTSMVYRIHGWRWHTRSVLRELTLLIPAVKTSNIKSLLDHTIGFTLRGLHQIEGDLFYPWLKNKLSLIEEGSARSAFQRLYMRLVDNKIYLSTLGKSMTVNDQVNPEDLREALKNMVEKFKEIIRLQDKFFVPAVSLLVSGREQSLFNSQLIRKLGILDSRLYLVSMYEAVIDDDKELKLFKDEIPSFPQYFLPRWKRLLYDPRFTSLLEGRDAINMED